MNNAEQIAYQTETRAMLLRDIDVAFESGEISALEARIAEAEVDETYPLAER